jgi:hypothetical protein
MSILLTPRNLGTMVAQLAKLDTFHVLLLCKLELIF